MKSFWNFVPLFLTKLIKGFSFPKKFFYGSLVITIPIILATFFIFKFLEIDQLFKILIIIFVLGLFVVLYLFFGAVYVSVLETIGELQRVTNKWKNGDLSARINIQSSDELKEIGLAFNEIATAFEQEIEEHKEIRYVIEQSLQKNNQLITAIDNLDIGIIITEADDNGNKPIYVNPGFGNITGYSESEIIGKNLSMLQGDKTSSSAKKKIRNAIQKKQPISLEILNYHKDGHPFWNYLTITPVYNEKSRLINFIGIVTDITKQKKSDEKIYELAYFDELTMLSNLNFMKEYVIQQINVGVSSYALFYIDIDRFKNLNSKLGFQVGNIVLQQFAFRLKEAASKNIGLLARATKDEYVLFIPYNGNKKNLEKLTDKITKLVSQPFIVNHYEFYLGASIGISIYPENSTNFDELLQCAETAMNEAKLNNYKKAIFYKDNMSQLYKESHELENQLKFAIERNELRLVYQPKICLKTGRLIGAEALVRWAHPQEGIISPAKFIAIAESTGLIFSLGSWVLEEACRKRKEWDEKGLGDFKLSVNVSAKQFMEGYFVPLIDKVLTATELNPQLLEIELTESALHEEENAQKLLLFLQNKSIAVSIDDFGTGYSSLNYLRILPINTLKIDRSFIIEMETNQKSYNLLENIISMGHGLNLNIIAEGVETKQQLAMLKEMGCNEVQGYLISKPLFEDEFEQFLENYDPKLIIEYFEEAKRDILNHHND